MLYTGRRESLAELGSVAGPEVPRSRDHAEGVHLRGSSLSLASQSCPLLAVSELVTWPCHVPGREPLSRRRGRRPATRDPSNTLLPDGGPGGGEPSHRAAVDLWPGRPCGLVVQA